MKKRKQSEPNYKNSMGNPRLRRPCEECGNYFNPNGKYGKLCDECRYKKLRKNWRGLGGR